MAACAALEPATPHATLHIAAVHPRLQRRGVGAELVATVLEHCDAEATPVWLASSNPDNVAFYERLGFRPTGTVPLPGGSVITTMLRPAGGSRTQGRPGS